MVKVTKVRKEDGGEQDRNHKAELEFESRLSFDLSRLDQCGQIDYMICIWGNTTPNLIKKAQIVMNMAGRFVIGGRRTTPKVELMNTCKWYDIVERTEMQSLIQMWKIARWKIPEYMSDKIKLEDDNRITTTIPRLQLTSNTFRWITTKKWNELPDQLRGETSLKCFKSGLKRLMADRRRPDPAPDED